MHHPVAGLPESRNKELCWQQERSDSRIDPEALTDKCLSPASTGLPAEVACCNSCCRAGLLTTARSAEPGKLPTSASPRPTTSSMYTSSLFPVSRHRQSGAGACSQVSLLALHTLGGLCSANAYRVRFRLPQCFICCCTGPKSSICALQLSWSKQWCKQACLLKLSHPQHMQSTDNRSKVALAATEPGMTCCAASWQLSAGIRSA